MNNASKVLRQMEWNNKEHDGSGDLKITEEKKKRLAEQCRKRRVVEDHLHRNDDDLADLGW